MATDGFFSLSSRGSKELFLCQLKPKEYAAGAAGEEAAVARISKKLGRFDLRAIKLLRVEQNQGMAIVIYQSIFDPEIEASAIKQQSPESFIKQGGRIQWVRS